jgi:hypothetical protein
MNHFVVGLAVVSIVLGQVPEAPERDVPATDASAAAALIMAAPSEEFNGPFASWRAVQCTGQDDTALLQQELNTLGRSGSPVLYIKPGTCRITASLKLEGVQYVTLLGHDPADTRITYAGKPGNAMLILNGVGHSRFGRLTWDGGGLAGYGYFDAWVPPAPYFPTALRHEDEVFQNLQGDGIAAYLGASGGGTAETTWMRERVVGPADAGLFLANYNVLNQWVWDSVFDHTMRGITNYIPNRVNGAGGFAANRSAFLHNGEADLETGNVANPYGDRWNYSRGGAVHAFGQGIGSAAPGWTAQGNIILDAPVNPIGLGHAGPLGLLDNTFRGGKAEGMLGVEEAYASAPTGDMWALGNTFSNVSTRQYSVPVAGGRFQGAGDDRVGQTISDPGYTQDPTPPVTNRLVFEPNTRDGAGVQAAVSAAVACGQPRCVVHLPFGNYPVASTISVAAGSDIQIVGDGPGATVLQGSGFGGPILALDGPSRAVVRDLLISAQGAAVGLSIRNANQTNGLVHAEDVIATGRVVGLQVDGVSQTAVDLLDFQAGSESDTTGGTAVQLVHGSKAAIFNGALGADTVYDVRDNSELVAQTVYEEGVSQRPVSVLAPGGSGKLVLDSGKLHSYTPGNFDASTFSGLVTVDNMGTGGITFKAGAGFLGLGVVSDTGTIDASAAPYAWWLPRRIDGSGSKPVQEQSAGIADPKQFLLDHLAPLRAAKPRALNTAPAGATDVRLYRVFIDTASIALRIEGTSQRSP